MALVRLASLQWDSWKACLPDWPDWALDVLLTMAGISLMTYGVSFLPQRFHTWEDMQGGESIKQDIRSRKPRCDLQKEFDTFRVRYLAVYLVVMLADWMQGFLSGAIFAPFLGSAVDKFGRKRSCVAYCVLEIIINTMEHSQNFFILLLGRILGGISTNLLFSAFESWMTSEHRKKGFPEEWLSRIYSECSIGNGAMAVVAGIVAQVLEDHFGQIGPFQGAIVLTSVALILILRWDENFGEGNSGDSLNNSSLFNQFTEGWKETVSDSRIWRIGLTQALSEGAMYTFVFMWVPTLLSLNPPGGLPTGCIFSALMMAISCGGMMFPPFHLIVSKYVVAKSHATELCASVVFLLASLSMVAPAVCLSLTQDGSSYFTLIISSFMLFEFCVGLFMPLAGTLRSKYVPDALQGGILNIFRLPLNAIVVSGTYATDVLAPADVFKLVSAAFYCAALLQATLACRVEGALKGNRKND